MSWRKRKMLEDAWHFWFLAEQECEELNIYFQILALIETQLANSSLEGHFQPCFYVGQRLSGSES